MQSENFKSIASNPPPEEDLIDLSTFSHERLLDTSTPPDFTNQQDTARYCALLDMNYLFLKLIIKFKLNIDDDKDVERADALVLTAVLCEGMMRRMLDDWLNKRKISEKVHLHTKLRLLDILLDHVEVVEWYTDLKAISVGKKGGVVLPEALENADAFVQFFVDTGAELGNKLRRILVDELCGSTDSSDKGT